MVESESTVLYTCLQHLYTIQLPFTATPCTDTVSLSCTGHANTPCHVLQFAKKLNVNFHTCMIKNENPCKYYLPKHVWLEVSVNRNGPAIHFSVVDTQALNFDLLIDEL